MPKKSFEMSARSCSVQFLFEYERKFEMFEESQENGLENLLGYTWHKVRCR